MNLLKETKIAERKTAILGFDTHIDHVCGRTDTDLRQSGYFAVLDACIRAFVGVADKVIWRFAT